MPVVDLTWRTPKSSMGIGSSLHSLGLSLDEVADLCISYEYSSIILIDGEEDKWGFDDSTEAERSFFPPSYPDGPEITQAFMCAIEGWEY